MNHNHVGAHLGNVGLNAALRALTDGQHGDDGGHANDDAEGRKERSHLVGKDGAERNLEQIGIIHG